MVLCILCVVHRLYELLGAHFARPGLDCDLAGANVDVHGNNTRNCRECLLDRVAALLSNQAVNFENKYIPFLGSHRCQSRNEQEPNSSARQHLHTSELHARKYGGR